VKRRQAELALTFNAIIWGFTFVLVKNALTQITPLLFLGMRFGLATLVLGAIYGRRIYRRATGPSPITRSHFGAGALTGLFLFAGFLFQVLGLKTTTPAKSAFITGLCTVMVPLLAMLVYRIRPRVDEMAGVLTATLGMGLLTLEGPIGGISRGDLLTFVGAVGFAAQIVASGHFAEKIGFEVLSVMQMTAAAIASFALAGVVEVPQVHWQPLVVWAILITGLLCTALAFTIQAWAQHHTTSTRTAVIYTLEPVVAWIASYCLAGEVLSRQAALGAVLILAGVLLVELKPFQSRLHLGK
jgi:drug/metabolite transporter (DMT)-like permease